MRNYGKLLIGAALALSVSGCSTADASEKEYTVKELADHASEVIETCSSSVTEMTVTEAMSANGTENAMTAVYQIEQTADPALSHIRIKAEQNGSETYTMEVYTQKEDDSYAAYILSNGEWLKETMSAEDLPDTGMDLYQLASKQPDLFQLSAGEAFNGQTCYKIYGSLSGKDLIGSLNEMADTFSLFTNDLESITIPIEMYVDQKTLEPAGTRIDMKDAMTDLISQAGTQAEAFAISQFDVTSVYSGFNDNLTIAIPAEALEAEETISEDIEDDENTDERVPLAIDTSAMQETLFDTDGLTTVTVRGKGLQLPFLFEELTAEGAQVTEAALTEMSAYDFNYVPVTLDENNQAEMLLLNMSANTVPLDQCTVYGISCSAENSEPGTITYKGGITLGQNVNTFFDILGAPSEAFCYNSEFNVYIWENDTAVVYVFTDLDTDIVTDIDLEYSE